MAGTSAVEVPTSYLFVVCVIGINSLMTRCRRNLDAALEHSKKAVELAPHVASYRDTMAEVLFQRGNKTEALELMKKCLKMPLANLGYYQRQIQRFERGNPKEEPLSEL